MAKHFSLREFQQGLSARLQALANAPSADVSKLGVQAGGNLWLVDLIECREVVTLPELIKVPLTRPWFSGVANIRGVLYSIVDFSAFTGGEPTALGPDTRVLLVGQKLAANCGILMDRMMGLRRFEQLQRVVGATPDAPWAGAEYTDNEGRRWKELRLRKLVEHTNFLQIGV